MSCSSFLFAGARAPQPARRSSKIVLPSALIVLLATACGDDDATPAAGGSGGATGVAGSSGSGGSGTAGSGGSPVSVEPDPLKDCGVATSPAVPALRLEQVVTGL